MPELELLVKKFGLVLSDTVSNQLKTLFTCRFYGKKLIPYQSIQKLDSPYLTFSLYNSEKAPVLIAVDAPIVYRLSNRLMGGEGVVETRQGKAVFTQTDQALGNHLIGWTQAAFRKQGVGLSLGKITDSPKFFYIYLPDELVWQVAFEVMIGAEQVGMIFLCVDRDFRWESLKETSA